jgi:hypothetical protein
MDFYDPDQFDPESVERLESHFGLKVVSAHDYDKLLELWRAQNKLINSLGPNVVSF